MNHDKLRRLKKEKANNEVLAASLIGGNNGRMLDAIRELVAYMCPSNDGWRKDVANHMRDMTDDDLASLSLLALHTVNNVIHVTLEENVKARN